MISSVRGTVLGVAGGTAVIEVGGVGLAVHVTPEHGLALRSGSEAFLHTALIVREDDLSLYGFADAEELEVFDLLRGVTGVGPKSALGVLAAMTPADIARAVSLEDDAAFRAVSGIGPKTAKLIIVSLAGKLSVIAGARARATSGAAAPGAKESVVIALVGLGWPERTAVIAADEALAAASESERTNTAALLRLALAALGPQKLVGSVES